MGAKKAKKKKNTKKIDTETIEKQVTSIGNDVNAFVNRLESLARSLPLIMFVIGKTKEETGKKVEEFFQKHALDKKIETGEIYYRISIEHVSEADRIIRRNENAELSSQIVPRSFLVSLVSEYDCFLWSLIRSIFYIRPELINASEKNLSFSQLIDFSSIEEAKEYIIEKEVESILRSSHSDQIKWLENKISIPLRKDLNVWPFFIEVTERRNLFSHCNGIVSRQYLTVCSNHDVTIDQKCKLGTQLHVDPKYFNKAFYSIFEMGVKLSHVIWRKLLPEDIKNADSNLSLITYDLIYNGHYSLAATLLDFATETLKKHNNDESRRVFIINRAIAYKWNDNNNKCNDILKQEDWSSCSDKFKLAVAVLNEDYDKAAKIMKRIGTDAEIVRKEDYRTWPLFKEFRKTKLFLESYESVFNETYMNVESKEKTKNKASQQND